MANPLDGAGARTLAGSLVLECGPALETGDDRAMLVDMDWVRRAFGAATPPSHSGPTDAAAQAVIAAILRQGAQGAELLLIRRAENPRDPWSGHMALPGGRRDASDLELIDTAIREISEEVQIDLRRDAQLLGRLPPARALTRTRDIDLAIFPIVFALDRGAEPVPNPREVHSIMWTSIPHLLSAAARSSFEYSTSGQRYRFPAFDVNGHRIWGLTYRVLSDLLSVIVPDRTGTPTEGSDGPKDL